MARRYWGMYTEHYQPTELVEGCATDTVIKPQLQHGELIPIVPNIQPPIFLHQCLPHHSTQNIPPLIGLCSSNMFVMKKQHIILSLLAGRAQFTKVEVGDKQRQYGWGVLRTMNHPAARVEQNIIESNISEHFHHN